MQSLSVQFDCVSKWVNYTKRIKLLLYYKHSQAYMHNDLQQTQADFPPGHTDVH